jgi:two-component system cell cycle sensor histidine kinase/response regulator CckA
LQGIPAARRGARVEALNSRWRGTSPTRMGNEQRAHTSDYAVTGRMPGPRRTFPGSRQKGTWGYLTILGFAVLATGGLVWHRLASHYRAEVHYWQARQSGVADDRLEIVSAWLEERRRDAEALAHLPSVQESASGPSSQAGLRPSKLSIQTRAKVALDSVVEVGHYSSAYVLDPKGSVVATSSRGGALSDKVIELCRTAALTGKDVVGLVSSTDGREELAVCTPVSGQPSARPNPPGSPLGLIVLLMDPSLSLFPILTDEPVPTRTGETVLMRRVGDEAVFISPLRFTPASAGKVCRSLEDPTFAARAALEGRETVGEFTDYRGVRVLASTRRVPLTGWGLVRKIDRAETLEDFYSTARLEVFLAVLFLLALGVVLALHSRAVLVRVLREEEGRFRQLLESFPDAALISSADGVIVLGNVRAENMLGYKLEELLGQPILRLVPEADREGLSRRYDGYFSNPAAREATERIEITYRRRDGSAFPAEVSLNLIGTTSGVVACSSLRDITERKQAEQALLASEEKFAKAFRSSPNIMAISTLEEGRFLEVNDSFVRMTGYQREEIIGRTVQELGVWVNPEDRIRMAHELRKGGRVSGREVLMRARSGKINVCLFSAESIEVRGVRCLLSALEDITERKQAEERFGKAFSASPEPITISALSDGTYIDVNQAFLDTTGYTREEVIGRTALDLKYWPEPEARMRFLDRLAQGSVRDLDVTFATKSGELRSGLLAAEIIEVGGRRCVLGITRDITERKRAEEAVRASEQRYRLLFERNLAGVCRATLDGRFLDCNDAYARMLGYEWREQILTQPVQSVYFEPAEREAYWARVLERGTLSNYELRLRRKDGSPVWVLANDTLLEERVDGQLVKEATLVDITERKQAEGGLRLANRALKAISAVNESILHATEERSLLREVCRCIVEHAGYRMVWVGFLRGDAARTIYPAAHAGMEEGYLDSINLTYDDSEWGRGPTGTAARTRRPAIVRDVSSAEEFAPWRGEASARGYASVVGLPLLCAENLLGVLTIYSAQPDAFDEREVDLLTELANDLAFGIQALRTRAEQAHTEQALRESEERFRSLVENATAGIYRTTPDGRILMANPALVRMLGYEDFAELATRNLEEQGFELGRPRRVFREQIERDGEVRGLEGAWTRRDGSVIFVRESGRVVRGASGEALYYDGVVEDITERKQAEAALMQERQLLHTLMDNLPDLIYFKDRESRFTRINPAHAKAFGLSDPAQALGKTDFDFFTDEHAQQAYADEQEIVRTGDPMVGKEEKETWPDGRVTWASTTKMALRDNNGNIVGTFGVSRDVTTRKALEEQLRLAQRMESVGRLAGGVAHDFNNLLTIIAGYSQLVKGGLDERSPFHAHLDEILRASDRAATLTQQLLAFSRKQVLQAQVLDLNAVLRDLEKMLTRLIDEDIELKAIPQPGLGRVKADPGQVDQVIMNLVVNARDAMPEGGTITIETANVELNQDYARSHFPVIPGRYVMLAVSDTGTGMSQEIQAHIFEPFFTTKETGKGTGLGLATVYGIVKQSGGYIWVYSEPGRGSTFKIYLPRVEESVAEPKSAEAFPDLVEGSETVLVVEDEEAVRSLVCKTLESHGYKVLEAQGADHALRILEEYAQPIHLLLTDVVMPRMSGKELAQRLSVVCPQVKVLYMSGYTDDAIVRHGILEPGVSFIQKPFTPRTLAQRVREVLDAGRRELQTGKEPAQDRDLLPGNDQRVD